MTQKRSPALTLDEGMVAPPTWDPNEVAVAFSSERNTVRVLADKLDHVARDCERARRG